MTLSLQKHWATNKCIRNITKCSSTTIFCSRTYTIRFQHNTWTEILSLLPYFFSKALLKRFELWVMNPSSILFFSRLLILADYIMLEYASTVCLSSPYCMKCLYLPPDGSIDAAVNNQWHNRCHICPHLPLSPRLRPLPGICHQDSAHFLFVPKAPPKMSPKAAIFAACHQNSSYCLYMSLPTIASGTATANNGIKGRNQYFVLLYVVTATTPFLSAGVLCGCSSSGERLDQSSCIVTDGDRILLRCWWYFVCE